MGKGKRAKQNAGKSAPSHQEQQRHKQTERNARQEFRRQRQRVKYQGTLQYKEDFGVLLRQLEPFHLTVTDVAADGNCMFRALSLQIHDDQDHHASIRKEICDFVEANRDNFEPFVEDDVPWEEYCSSMRDDGEWASHIQLQAASVVFKANISIHQANEARWDIVNFPESATRLHLSYHDHSHYASVGPIRASDKMAEDSLTSIAPAKEEGPNKEETLIMQSTAIDDLGLIRRTMQNFNYDVDAVYDYLFSLKEMEQAVSVAEHFSPEEDSTFHNTDISSSTTQEQAGNKAKPRMRKADRKRLKKMEKAQKGRTEAQPREPAEPMEEMKALRI